MPRFSASLGFFFTEAPFLRRFELAADSGFGAVEFFWPRGLEPADVERARAQAGVEVALFNMHEGDYEAGERGFAGVPERRDWWRARLAEALELAARVGCRRVNVLTGDAPRPEQRDAYLSCLADNLRWAAPQAREAGVTLVVEPLNPETHPRYLCQRTADVLDLIDRVGSPYVALQYDVYQSRLAGEDIVQTINAHNQQMAHIQLADVPGRGQPGSGVLDFDAILEAIDGSGYEGFVGLEYQPPAGDDPAPWLPLQERG